MHGAKDIIKEAESLPVEERAFVIDSLLRTLNPPDPILDRKWVEIAKQRLEQIRSGQVKTVSGNEVFDKVRERFIE